ncbi:hypothetical protein [Photobacterium leiognathi]|uniref:hypothetical protein n=1 Tax=Photobacterium leiognathi TaxID=553611 RepID=UPI002981A8A5|nr:hypothetical protein [Photobacterium leiognathi]
MNTPTSNIFIIEHNKSENSVMECIAANFDALSSVSDNVFSGHCDSERVYQLLTNCVQRLKAECEKLNESSVQVLIGGVNVRNVLNKEIEQLNKIIETGEIGKETLEQIKELVQMCEAMLAQLNEWNAVKPICVRIQANHDAHDLVFSFFCEEKAFLEHQNSLKEYLTRDVKAKDIEFKINK